MLKLVLIKYLTAGVAFWIISGLIISVVILTNNQRTEQHHMNEVARAVYQNISQYSERLMQKSKLVDEMLNAIIDKSEQNANRSANIMLELRKFIDEQKRINQLLGSRIQQEDQEDQKLDQSQPQLQQEITTSPANNPLRKIKLAHSNASSFLISGLILTGCLVYMVL